MILILLNLERIYRIIHYLIDVFIKVPNELPLKAAKPETMLQTNAVTKINKILEPANGNNSAIFCESILWFFKSIQTAMMLHNKKIPTKPAKKLLPYD